MNKKNDSPKKTRSLKVYYGHHGNSYKQHPVIHLAGQYLAQMDFNIGDNIEATFEKEQIVIRKTKNPST